MNDERRSQLELRLKSSAGERGSDQRAPRPDTGEPATVDRSAVGSEIPVDSPLLLEASGTERAVAAVLEDEQSASGVGGSERFASEDESVAPEDNGLTSAEELSGGGMITAGESPVTEAMAVDGVPVLEPAEDTYAEASEVVLEPSHPAPRKTLPRRGSGAPKETVTIDELLTTELAARAASATSQLRALLVGKFIIELRDKGDRYLFDWSNDSPVLGKTRDQEADCVLNLDSDAVLSIAEGRLNPQIALLSHKVRVTGKLALAMYFFNLLHPNGFSQSLG